MFKYTRTILLAAFLYFMISPAIGQMKSLPAYSPRGEFSQQFALTSMTVSYGRPGVKDRAIFGELIPYNKIWRAGANAPTTFSFSDDVKINDQELVKGSYVILIKPYPDHWDIIFNKNPEVSYTNYIPEDNALVVSAPVMKTDAFVETWTISTSDIKDATMDLNLMWANQKVALRLYNEVDAEMKKEFARKLAGPTASDYFGYARYLYNSGQDMEEALTHISKAVEMNKGYGNLRYKGLILAKLERLEEAIDWLTQSRDRAASFNNDDYVKINEISIAEVKKKMK